MPVSSGNEEAKVLARKLSDISAGVPLKKRRFLMVHSSSPPPAPSEGTDVKRNEECSSDSKTDELVRSDSQGNEASFPESTKEEVVEDVKNKLPAGINSETKVESGGDAKDKEEPSSDLGTTGKFVTAGSDAGKVNLMEVKKEIVSAPSFSLSMDVVVPSLPQERPAVESDSENRVENRTELLFFTGQSSPLGAPRSSGNPNLVNVKREMESKQVEDCNLKLSTVCGNDGDGDGGDDDQTKLGSKGSKKLLQPRTGHLNMLSDVKDMPASVLSLSLSKEVPSDGKIVSANRSNWDLNTTMDAWEGSNADAGFQSHVDGSAKKTESIHESLSSGSVSAISVLRGKGKQVISTSEPIPSLSTSSLKLIQHPEDSLSLTLSPSFHKQNFARVLSGLPTNIAPRRDVLRVQNAFDESSISKNTSDFRVVKSEPADGNPTATSSTATELLIDAGLLKGETTEKQKTQALTLTASSPQKSTEQRGTKSEPTSEAREGMCCIEDLTMQLPIGKFAHSQESGSSSSSILTMSVTPPNPSPSWLPASSELSVSADVSNLSEYSVQTKESTIGAGVLVQSAADLSPAHCCGKDENFTDSDVGNTIVVAKNVNESQTERVKDPLQDSRANVEGAASDEEKINLMEDESYGSDYESDSNQALDSQLGRQKKGVRDDEEYEDGEVRESLLQSKKENPTTGNGIIGDSAKLIADNNDAPSGFRHGTEQFQLDDVNNELKIQEDETPDYINDKVKFISNDQSDQFPDKDGPSQNLSVDGMAETVHEMDMELCNSDQRKSADSIGDNKSCAESLYKDSFRDATNSGQLIVTAGEAKGEMFNTAERHNSSYHIVEASSNDTNAAKDSSLGGSRSRIINLPRATSPSRTRSIPDKLPSSRNGRERYSDLDEDKFYLRGNRDEMGTDGSHRFGRGRFQDQSFRNSRGYYSRGRGRFSGRHGTSRSDWSSDRDFSVGSYSDEYRFTRNKRTMPNTELDCEDYVASDSSGRGRGRKSLNDDFRHPSSRRFSPCSRDGPASRGAEMVRRVPRNISPSSRRNDENGMGMVGLRHDEKYVRVLSDDMVDHAYTRQHSMYEGGDGQYIRGNRNPSNFQRRGFQRARSKSPVGSRTRSPGVWSSPRRRSPDGFNGLPQMGQHQHRSPAMYGVERMRSSPDRSCFPEQQMVARRRSSPSFMARPANDSRDVDPSRPISSSRRSPPERVFNRSNRRLDQDLDPRLRTGEEYFGGRPVHIGRFHEFHPDGNSSSDERRKFGERRGMSRPFKPTYMGGSEGDTGHSHSHNTTRFHTDDGPRPMRFCSESDQEFAGRGGGMREREREREREFDGRMKNRQIGAPRRMRNMDDPEGSFRQQQQQQQVWHDEGGFNEGSGFKRRRFQL